MQTFSCGDNVAGLLASTTEQEVPRSMAWQARPRAQVQHNVASTYVNNFVVKLPLIRRECCCTKATVKSTPSDSHRFRPAANLSARARHSYCKRVYNLARGGPPCGTPGAPPDFLAASKRVESFSASCEQKTDAMQWHEQIAASRVIDVQRKRVRKHESDCRHSQCARPHLHLSFNFELAAEKSLQWAR